MAALSACALLPRSKVAVMNRQVNINFESMPQSVLLISWLHLPLQHGKRTPALMDDIPAPFETV